eukprot:8903899-Pyramimonas_sp.AAC.1
MAFLKSNKREITISKIAHALEGARPQPPCIPTSAQVWAPSLSTARSSIQAYPSTHRYTHEQKQGTVEHTSMLSLDPQPRTAPGPSAPSYVCEIAQ